MIGTYPCRAAARPTLRFRAISWEGLILLAALVAAAAFLLVDTRPVPVRLWDESRNIVNALEMNRTGFSLITTYGGAPDLWNTKPPLLIWLMVLSVRLFGASEWALRLPSLLATLGTLAIVMTFVRRVSGSVATAVLAAALFALSPAWFGEHGARTADYEPLLVFFTTAYLVVLFGAVHRAPSRWPRLALAALAVTGAVLTKSVAGLMPGLGVGVWLVASGRTARLWQGPRYAVAAAGVAVATLMFVALRDVASPGYVAMLWHNELGGRFAGVIDTSPKPVGFYLADLWAGYFSATTLLLLAPVAMRNLPARARLGLGYALTIVVVFLLVITAAASKLHHYLLPAIPFMAIAAALSAQGLLRRFSEAGNARAKVLAAALLMLGGVSVVTGVASGVARRYLISASDEGAASAHYGALLDRLVERGWPITVIDPGFARTTADRHYTPVLRAYRLMWQARGLDIAQRTTITAARGILASCDRGTARVLAAHSRDIGATPPCVAIRQR